VNSLAQAAGIAALSDTEHLEKGREVVNAGKNFLAGTARELGLAYSSGAANFMLLKVGRAQEVRLAMLKHHRICVRDCSSFGLPEYIRVGIRTADDNRKLAEALGHVMVERGAVA
jgi:histidinol-phosphate aminotransferase